MHPIIDLKSPNFLGGTNVHNLVIIGLAVAIAVKVGVFKK